MDRSDDLPSPTFCALPWIHLCGSVDGVWGRCCVDGSMYHDDLYRRPEEPTFTLQEEAIGALPLSRYAADNPDKVFNVEEAFDSPLMRQTRRAMLNGEKVSACTYCYDREAGGGESYRLKANRMFLGWPDMPQRIADTKPDGALDAFPSFLDIRFGNTCNLRCIMCDYPVSSRWGTDRSPAWAPANIDAYRDDEELWATLEANAHRIRRMYFAGGEPFLQPGHFKMLDLLVDGGHAPGVDIVYTSNLTILPDGVFERFSHFKSVGIGGSCDGVGPVFEKIRTGARWDTFVANLREVRSHVDDVWLQVAPQKENIAHLDEVVEFAYAEKVPADFTNIVYWPAEFSVRTLPEDERAAHAARIDELVELCRRRSMKQEAEHLAMLASFLRS